MQLNECGIVTTQLVHYEWCIQAEVHSDYIPCSDIQLCSAWLAHVWSLFLGLKSVL